VALASGHRRLLRIPNAAVWPATDLDHFWRSEVDRFSKAPKALEEYGASTWGATQDEAHWQIKEVVQMIIEERYEDGIALADTSI
jgi:hypothetical protein